MTNSGEKKQLLHLVFGGELESLDDVQFRDLSGLDIVGIFPDYASALTMRTCAILSSTCTACWIRKTGPASNRRSRRTAPGRRRDS
jgi:hypothetical protein